MHIKTSLGMILLSLLPDVLYAQNQNTALVQELYVRSGLEKQLEQVPLAMLAGLDQVSQGDDNLRRLPRNLISAIKGLAQEAFAPAVLKEVMLRELEEKLTAQDIKEVLNWLDSPLGKKCTQLEEAASTPQALAERQQYAAQLQTSPPSKERLNMFREFDSATKTTESAVEMIINTQVAVALAMTATLQLEQQRSLDDISREFEKNRPNIEAAVRSQILISFLHTYKDLTDAEIQQYVEFARSAVGTKYHSVGLAALKKAFVGSSLRWGKSIGDAIKQLKNQTDT